MKKPGSPGLYAAINAKRDRIAAGTNLSQPVPVKPAAKPAAEVKKVDKGA